MLLVRKCKANDCVSTAAIMMEDSRTGQRYLEVKHFLTRGVPASLITFVVIITVGYGLMLAVGF